HIYTRLGEYQASVTSNLAASAADLAYLRSNPPSDDVAMSYRHDLESLAIAAGFLGRLAAARQAAAEIARVEAGLAGEARTFAAALAFVLLRFQRWEDVVALPAPEADDLPALMMSHYARAVALRQLGRVQSASAERRSFEQTLRRLPQDAVYRGNSIATVTAL